MTPKIEYSSALIKIPNNKGTRNATDTTSQVNAQGDIDFGTNNLLIPDESDDSLEMVVVHDTTPINDANSQMPKKFDPAMHLKEHPVFGVVVNRSTFWHQISTEPVARGNDGEQL